MDKEKSSIAEAGSLIKAITAAQDTRRIREVEFGCGMSSWPSESTLF